MYDEYYRRRILTQLNRREGRNAVARAICYGQRGEIRKRYSEGLRVRSPAEPDASHWGTASPAICSATISCVNWSGSG
ncbi:Tn3 family transposase [Citrobacter freundii]|uniref:Transposase n=4 Tax=Enterobacteriaceae TaxID=543 RepID=A0A7A3C107_ECOLX|nr:Tn3 family transposase [Escherichia coli]EHA3708994.1 transposase [Citrobacter freundii]EHF5042710.1 transposase [Enterobacter asburiae]EIW8766122.1 hypothetical protein [Klebsiella pneumoniae]EIY2676929.1 Tn3 family transposase [Raoultella planticola]EJZ8387361.1 Tn3 family transposase [Klebsiella oxytoca]EKT8665067.1 Tn3 family transposase [Klebsiella quasipneumoniae]EKU2863334.1 Tn3 family transposase [Raoultella ornithinolytica]EKU4499395.1 Tn3 family transposase [Enterobacter hormae